MLVIILLIILIFLIASKFGGDADADKKHGGPQSYYMGAVWFENAKSGKKVADLRPGPAEKCASFRGRNIVFEHKGQQLPAKILHGDHYKKWTDLDKDAYKVIAPHLGSNAELIEVMEKYYNIAETGGFCVLYFEAEGVKPATPDATAALKYAASAKPLNVKVRSAEKAEKIQKAAKAAEKAESDREAKKTAKKK